MIRFSLRSPLVLLLILSLAVLSLWTYKHEPREFLASAAASFSVASQNVAAQSAPLPHTAPPADKTRRLIPDEAFRSQDGLLYLADVARPGVIPENQVEHPIAYLVREAERKWNEKVASQSKTLQQAVATYRHKYGRAPPAGFDKWFSFAREKEVILVDDYDQINRDILPMLGLPSKPLQERSRIMIEDTSNYYYGGSFTLHVKAGKIAQITGGKATHTRRSEQESLLQPFVHLLPDLNITIWIDDGPVMHVTGEKRQELEELAAAGRSKLWKARAGY